MSDLKDKIMAADDSSREAVDVPEWGVTVYVKNLTAGERAEWEKTIRTVNGEVDTRGVKERLLVRCIVDEDGGRIFDDGDADDLSGKSSLAVDRLWQVADRINAVSDNQIESAEEN